MASLLEAVVKAHEQSALNNADNVSSTIVRQLAYAGKSFPEAVAAAILSLGEKHAPITKARYALCRAPLDELRSKLVAGGRIPGFGNSFFKDDIDPAWTHVDEILRANHGNAYSVLGVVADLIFEVKQVRLYPNAAAYTALAAELAGVAWGTEYTLLFMGRMNVWAKQYHEAL